MYDVWFITAVVTCGMEKNIYAYIYSIYKYAFNCFLLCHKSQSSHDPKQANRKASHESFAMRKSRWKILVHGILFPYFQRPINYFPQIQRIMNAAPQKMSRGQ
jgi:hypothetical protein